MSEPMKRVEQLRRGITGAAAALPQAHAGLGSRATAAAGRVASGPAGSGSRKAAEGAPDAVPSMERLHYALLRVAVLGETPAEAGLEEALEALEALAGERAAPTSWSPGAG